MGVRTALVGYGYWGPNLARNIQASTALELTTLADGDPARREDAGRLYPAARLAASLDAVLADDDVEAVVLATPAAGHAAEIQQVLSSGRHVLVEKPMATTVEDAEAVLAASERVPQTLMVGHTFLYSAPVRWLRTAIKRGDLGAVQYLASQRLNLGRIRSDCNALWNFGPHDVSIVLYLLDELPAHVSATGFAFLQPGIEDVCFVTLQFASGVAANVHLSWIDPRKVRLMTVVGDQRMAVYDDVSVDRKVSLYDAGAAPAAERSLGSFTSLGDFQWRTRAGDIVLPRLELREPLLVEMEEFGRCCTTGEAPLTDAAHGLDVVRVLCAADESIRRDGVPIEVAK